MFHYVESITDVKGNALTGYFVALVQPDPNSTTGGVSQLIYADDSGTPIISASGVDSKAKVDPDGNVSLYVPVGTYHVDIYEPDGSTWLKRILNIPMMSGQAGTAATVTIGATTTLSAGSSATVTNVGNTTNAILNFGIPMGATGSGTSFAWGAATGTLSNQTDLQNALNAKAPLASPVFTGTPTAPTPTVGDNSTNIATTAFVVANAATLASPAFTGTPTSTTAAQDTNTTQIATTAFVIAQASAVNPLMDGSVAIGTSLRFARADHVHPTDTSRAPLTSPGFSGTPTAPTATAGTNTTQIATTAFVQTAVSSASGDPWKITKLTADASTTSTTLVTSGLTVAGSNFVANSYYEIEAVLSIKCPSGNGDMNLAFVWPSGVTGSASIIANDGTASAKIASGDNTATITTAAIGTTSPTAVSIRAVFYTGSLAATGSLDIQYKAVAGTVYVPRGSVLRYRAL